MLEPGVASAETPTAWRIITRDQDGIKWLVVFLLSPIVGLLLRRVAPDIAGSHLSDQLLRIASLVAAFGAATFAAFRLALRVRCVRNVFRNGLRLKAEVLNMIECGPSVVLADLEYSVSGKRFSAVSPPLSIRYFTSDQTLSVLVDPDRPEELFFPQLWS